MLGVPGPAAPARGHELGRERTDSLDAEHVRLAREARGRRSRALRRRRTLDERHLDPAGAVARVGHMSTEAPVTTPSGVAGHPHDVPGRKAVPMLEAREPSERLPSLLRRAWRSGSLRETKPGHRNVDHGTTIRNGCRMPVDRQSDRPRAGGRTLSHSTPPTRPASPLAVSTTTSWRRRACPRRRPRRHCRRAPSRRPR